MSQGYNIPFLDATIGKICLSGDQGERLDIPRMRNILLRFGEIYSLDAVDRGCGKDVIVCEYFDRRTSVEVIDSLHGREILVPHNPNPLNSSRLLFLLTHQSICMFWSLMEKGVRLAAWMDVHPMMHLRIHRPFAPVMDSRSSSYSRVYPPYTSPTAPYYGGGMDSPCDLWPTTTKSPTTPLSRFNFFSDIDNAPSPLRRSQLPLSSETSYHPEIPRRQPSPSGSSSSPGKWTATDLENYFNQMRITTPPSARQVLAKATENMSILRSMHGAVDLPADEKGFQGKGLEEGNVSGLNSLASPSADTESSSGGESCSLGSNGGIPEKNRVVLEKVMMGLDKKTTIMIKNVPNKYTQVPCPSSRFVVGVFLD